MIKDISTRSIVWDNGGETMDRYSVLIDKKYVYSMSVNPLSPMGFNQYAGNIEQWNNYEDADDFIRIWDEKETRMDIGELPVEVRMAIAQRIEE